MNEGIASGLASMPEVFIETSNGVRKILARQSSTAAASTTSTTPSTTSSTARTTTTAATTTTTTTTEPPGLLERAASTVNGLFGGAIDGLANLGSLAAESTSSLFSNTVTPLRIPIKFGIGRRAGRHVVVGSPAEKPPGGNRLGTDDGRRYRVDREALRDVVREIVRDLVRSRAADGLRRKEEGGRQGAEGGVGSLDVLGQEFEEGIYSFLVFHFLNPFRNAALPKGLSLHYAFCVTTATIQC